MNPYLYVISINGLLFFFSVVFYFFPPKKINTLYGYRTNRSIQNKEVWEFANSYFIKQLLIYATISFCSTLLLAFIVSSLSWQPTSMMILSLAVSVIKTEQELNKNFDKEGKRLN